MIDLVNGPIAWRKAHRTPLCPAMCGENTQCDEKSTTCQSKHQREKYTRMKTSSDTWQLGGQTVQVSHLEKVYWPQTGFTKGDLLDYYGQIAPILLPHMKDRPVTLRVYPQGVAGTSYYLG